MKFSHSLQFNAVPEWSSKYIAYSHLKKLIYALQKEKLYSKPLAPVGDLEQAPLLGSDESNSYTRNPYVIKFIQALDKELKKIDKFFISQETGILANYHELKDDVKEFENNLMNNRLPSISDALVIPSAGVPKQRATSVSSNESMNSNLQLSIESAPAITSIHSNSQIGAIPSEQMYGVESRNTYGSLRDFSNSQSNIITPLMQHKVTLKKRLIAIFTQLSELKDFIDLNQTGFSKICKKFDKSLITDIKSTYLKSLGEKSHVFNRETILRIENIITETIVTYAKLNQEILPITTTSAEDEQTIEFQSAEKELKSHLREHVVWERNTVWKDMINLERKSQNVKTKTSIDGADNAATVIEAIESKNTSPTEILFQSSTFWNLLVITLIFSILLKSTLLNPFDDLLQRNCFAIVIYASMLWATETLPLFVTSLLIPLLVVIFPVLKDPVSSTPYTAVQSSQYILSTMWSSVIMLLLGGFTLAAALSKYNVAKILSTYILASAGTNPQIILLTNMGVALFVSMWVSNVAAPVLCYSIIQPLLRTLPSHCSYSKSLILGIALASNVGGMASPIASPQNIFSFGIMNPPPSWGEWFFVAIPVCVISVLLIWMLLLITFPIEPSVKILQIHAHRDSFTLTQWFVSIVSLGTIVLWCLSNQLSGVMGEMGIISIIPIIVFFGTGLLTSDDFNNFMWTIVVLAMGGATLGKAVSNCGLLSTMAHSIKELISGQPLFIIAIGFGGCVIVMATFVSHTVAAMILVPLMGEIGENLPDGDHSRLLIMITSLLCSCAMGLPTSGFPNVTAISMIDEIGDRYLKVGDFITRGVPASLFCYSVVVTVGYTLMRVLGY